MNCDYIELTIAFISAFIAIVTLIATIVIGKMQINQNIRMDKQNQRQDERDEQRRNDAIYSAATKFILKYSASNHTAEIYLLPLCVIAYKYNPIYPYRRKIYREFCSLTEEVQNCILKRQNIDITSAKEDGFFGNMLEALKSDIKKNYPNDPDWYYDCGKYFKGALLYHGCQKIITVKCNADKYYAESLKKIPNNLDKDVMDYESHIINLLSYEKNETPIDKLMHEDTSIGIPASNNDDILISYLECIIAKYVPYHSYLHGDYKFKNIGYHDEFQGTKYMEDLFLDALFNIYVHH